MGDLTKNFSLREFRCRDGTEVPLQYHGNVQALAAQLQLIRDEIDCPLIIHSAYRTEAHNVKVKGAARSKHLTGEAADLRPKGKSVALLHAVILRLIHSGRIHAGGVGLYARWVHYDLGRARRWGP